MNEQARDENAGGDALAIHSVRSIFPFGNWNRQYVQHRFWIWDLERVRRIALHHPLFLLFVQSHRFVCASGEFRFARGFLFLSTWMCHSIQQAIGGVTSLGESVIPSVSLSHRM